MNRMLDKIDTFLEAALGLELKGEDINLWQMSLRAFIVFFAAIAMIRLGNKRFMGKNTAMDVMLGIVFGSVVSRAITGNAPFFPALAAGVTLVAVHWAVSAIGFRSHSFGTVFKGHETLLIQDGEMDRKAMKKSHISEHDLQEALRNHGKEPDIGQVKAAHLERDGKISIISR